MQQKSEFPFDDLTMESEHEVTRVIRYFSLPHVSFWGDPDIVEKHVLETSGDFKMFFVDTDYRVPRIIVEFESGYRFNFLLYQVGITKEAAVCLFNEFIENNTDAVCEFMLEHPLWMTA